MTRPASFPWFCAMLACLAAGCAGYRVGPTNGLEAGQKSVQVNLFRNETETPRVIEVVAQSLRRELQQDGTFRLETGGPGDVVVDGVIRDLYLEGLSFRRGDLETVRDYRSTLLVEITARDRLSGRTNLHQTFRGITTLRYTENLGNAVEQALPRMADDVARKITHHLVDGTW